MATIQDVTHTLHGWIRWLRFQRALTWALRGLVVGLAASLVIGAVGLWQARLLRAEFLSLILYSAFILSLVSGLAAYLWPVPSLKAARFFDLKFGLGERVSTALELSRQNVTNELTHRQLEDAFENSRRVKPSRDLPLRFQKLEGLFAILLVVLFGLIWFRGEAWFAAAAQRRAVEQAVAEQAAQIEEIIRQIQNNEALTEEQKQELVAPLEEAQRALEENPSLEGAVSILTSAGEELQAMSDPQAEEAAQAFREAGESLAGEEGSPLQSVGENLAEGDIVSAASELANIDVSQLSAEEANQLADQLEAMADSLEATNPELASELNQAAEALRNGDTAAAQQALNRAAQAMARSGQQIIRSQTAGEAAGQLQEGAGQVIAAGGGQQPGQTPGQGQPGSSQSGGTTQGAGAGSGQGEAQGQGSQPGGESSDSPIPQDNGPGDGGETPYEQIYAPSLLGGDEGQTVNLPSSGEDGETIGTGPTSPSDSGESLVPYDRVYSVYDEANQQAIESGEIPFQFISIIRNYFDSLEP